MKVYFNKMILMETQSDKILYIFDLENYAYIGLLDAIKKFDLHMVTCIKMIGPCIIRLFLILL